MLAGTTPVLVHNICPTGVFDRAIGNHSDSYVELSAKNGWKYFGVPIEHWEKLSANEQWAANQKFLDRGIAGGDTFHLATRIDKMVPNSVYAREVNYLMENGYTFNNAGDAMIPK